MQATNHFLYIGTDNGLLRATHRSGSAYDLDPCGLAGKLVSGIVVDAGDPACLFVATRNDGMHRSRDGGKTWTEINSGILYKEIWSLVQHPATGELYAGTAPPAVFKSSNRGETWAHCSSLHRMEESLHWTFPPPPHFAHVRDLQIVPEDQALVYDAIEEGWIIRSTDGGATWETLKQGVAFDSHAVTILPDDPRMVIATTGVGVFRSENGGDKFVRSDEGIEAGGFTGAGYMSPAAVHPARPNVVFAGAAEVPPPFWFTRAEGARAFFYRSDDRGKTWKKLAGKGLPDVMRAAIRSCVIHPSEPGTVFFGMTDGSVWLTEDDGASFRRIVEGLPGWIAGLTVAVPTEARRVEPVRAAPTAEPSAGEARVGDTYTMTISAEIDNPFIGPNGVGRIGDADVRIPHAKTGETYQVKVLAIGPNHFTGRTEATIQKLAGPT